MSEQDLAEAIQKDIETFLVGDAPLDRTLEEKVRAALEALDAAYAAYQESRRPPTTVDSFLELFGPVISEHACELTRELGLPDEAIIDYSKLSKAISIPHFLKALSHFEIDCIEIGEYIDQGYDYEVGVSPLALVWRENKVKYDGLFLPIGGVGRRGL